MADSNTHAAFVPEGEDEEMVLGRFKAMLVGQAERQSALTGEAWGLTPISVATEQERQEFGGDKLGAGTLHIAHVVPADQVPADPPAEKV